MREIKFRGKSIETGEWVYGSLNTHYDSGKGSVTIWGDYNDFENVDPETVGQFIGYSDKNGTNVYEDDVVEEYHGNAQIVWSGTAFALKYLSTNFSTYSERLSLATKYYVNSSFYNDTEVTGNIHDKPKDNKI